MSRAARRREARKRPANPGRSRRSKAPLWIMSGSIGAALLVLAIIAPRRSGPGHHPMPRVDAPAAHVMPAARYSQTPRVAETYAMAAEIPAVLDGMYCYCLCATTFGHYSLLECFQGDHAAGCDICLNEAVIAYQMTKRGDSLDDIRQAVDQQYRT